MPTIEGAASRKPSPHKEYCSIKNGQYSAAEGKSQTDVEEEKVGNGRPAIAKSKLPNAEKVVVDPRKIIDYALNSDNLAGGANKAKVFESALGYNQSNAKAFMEQLQENLRESKAILEKLDQYGQWFTVDVPITGPNGNTAIVRTGWICALPETVDSDRRRKTSETAASGEIR